MKKYFTSKWLWLLVILVIAAGGGGYWYTHAAKDTKTKSTQQTAVVTRGDIISVVSSTGTIQPVNSVDISAKITARIKEVKVKDNDVVTAGQTLVILEDDELQSQLKQAQDKTANTAAKYKRIQRLNQIGAKADQDMEDALLDYQNAVTNYEVVQSQVNDTIIAAPMNGMVIGKPLTVGTMVAQGVNNPTVIMTIADMSLKQINAQIDETDIPKIHPGQKTTFTIDGYPNKTFRGKVANVSQKATTSQNVVTYSVLIDVEDPDNALKPSMTARVSIITGEKKDVLTVPLSAIKTNKNGQYVTVLSGDGKENNVPVTVGLYGDDKVEIIGGVNEGDKLVISYKQPTEQNQKSNMSPPPIRL